MGEGAALSPQLRDQTRPSSALLSARSRQAARWGHHKGPSFFPRSQGLLFSVVCGPVFEPWFPIFCSSFSSLKWEGNSDSHCSTLAEIACFPIYFRLTL